MARELKVGRIALGGTSKKSNQLGLKDQAVNTTSEYHSLDSEAASSWFVAAHSVQRRLPTQ